jgi:hypothetical protein
MTAMTTALAGPHSPDQAAELAVLVEMEARWENQRAAPGAPYTTGGLKDRQRVYEDYRVRLAGYNRRYAPAHVPEPPINNAVRLGRWCRAVRDLFARVEDGADIGRPAHALEKAYRWADRIAARRGKDPVSRAASPDTIQAALRGLDAVSRWCDDVNGA